jgi:hypothetical protein
VTEKLLQKHRRPAPASLRLGKIAAVWVGDWAEASEKGEAEGKDTTEEEGRRVFLSLFRIRQHSADRRALFDWKIWLIHRGPIPNRHVAATVQ